MITDRHNSLNFLRLLFALMVIVGHARTLGGWGLDAISDKTTVGTVAVYGFFGISGYLIAGSADRNGVGRYLWQRFLRIFPAFWICLLVTVCFFGVIGWFHSGRPCGLSCYATAHAGPFDYVVHNFWLRVSQPQISGTPKGVPEPLVWNGSLWTLFYEFLCYLLLGALAMIGLLSRRFAVLSFGIATWIAEWTVTSVPSLNRHFGVFQNWDLMQMLVLFPIFITGALLYLFRDEIPDWGVVALISGAIFVGSLWVPLGASKPAYTLTSTALLAPALVYPVLWLGAHLPMQRIGNKNDYSYGTYIYAFPVQQLLALWGAYHLGWVAYTVLGILMTAPFAVTSWWLVERPALALKRFSLRPLGSSNSTAPQADFESTP